MHEIRLCGQPLNLDLTLSCGQAFRWTKGADGVWRGVVRDKLLELAVDGDILLWRTYPECDLEFARDYLRLEDDVTGIYAELGKSDPVLADLTERFHGLRLLRQDPAETLLSFICSAASSIPRITAGIEALAATYGTVVCVREEGCYHTFPTPETIACQGSPLLGDTRYLGFRDRKLVEVCSQVIERGPNWLRGLRAVGYVEARDALMAIKGVGPKIADCVCLFSLNKDQAVPVDTHVVQLASRLWGSTPRCDSLTAGGVRRIHEEFAGRFGPYAGWAQQFLYFEQLTHSRSLGRGVRWRDWCVAT